MNNRSPDPYIHTLNLYVQNLCEVAEAAWIEHYLDRYTYRAWILEHVSPARRMAQDFASWATTECSWNWGTGQSAGEVYYRHLDTLVKTGSPSVERECWDRALRQLDMGEDAWKVAEKHFAHDLLCANP